MQDLPGGADLTCYWCKQGLLSAHMQHIAAVQPLWMRVKLALTAHFCQRLRTRVERVQAELAESQTRAAQREMDAIRESREREEEMCAWAEQLEEVGCPSHALPCSV